MLILCIVIFDKNQSNQSFIKTNSENENKKHELLFKLLYCWDSLKAKPMASQSFQKFVRPLCQIMTIVDLSSVIMNKNNKKCTNYHFSFCAKPNNDQFEAGQFWHCDMGSYGMRFGQGQWPQSPRPLALRLGFEEWITKICLCKEIVGGAQVIFFTNN